MRKAFKQPESPSLIRALHSKFNHVLRCFSDNVDWIKTKTGLIEQTRQPVQQEDVELADIGSADVNPVGVELDSKPKRYPWTQAHSLYATMGGFVVDTRDLGLNYLPDGRQRMTLTLYGLEYIAAYAPHLLPDLPESVILDKSKANAFTKLVTCGQAVWFCVQCATRSAQGLSISLLEINTAVHAICTLIMYFHFWWHKPLDVEEPTMLTSVDIHSVMAFLVITRKIKGVKFSLVDLDDEHFDSEPDSEDVITHPRLEHIKLKRSKDPQLPSPDYAVYHGFAIPWKRNNSELWRYLTEEHFQCLKLASNSARTYGLHVGRSPTETYLKGRLRNRPQVADFKSAAKDAAPIVGFTIAGLFYGCVHLLVWDRPFRGETDKLLWKISSLAIFCSGLPWLIWVSLLPIFDDPKRHPRIERYLWYPIGWLSLVCVGPFYIFCRTFLIVECFLDVFNLPDSAFEVPRWAQYFPHIG